MHRGKWAFLYSLGIALCLLVTTVRAEDQLGYYRWSTAYGDQVVFVAENDLWTAPLPGGMARRLTTAPGEERYPLFSPDGKWIAFGGTYDGNMDVYVMPAEGGEPRRLTYHPSTDYPTGWTPEGRISFRSLRDPGPGVWRGYVVSLEGSYPEPLPIDEAGLITFEPGGDRVAYNQGVSNYIGYGWWKRYKGGMATEIWVGSLKTHDYRNVTNSDGNDTSPMWWEGRIYFMRDNDARMNIHSMKPDGSDIQQHTFHTEWDARWPTLADGKLCYSLGADIWVFDIAKNETRKIDITLPSDMLLARDKFVSPDDYTDDGALSSDGKRLLIAARGEMFTAPTERRGVIRQISHTVGAREKSVSFMPDDKEILAWSDHEGEEALYLYPADRIGDPKKVADGASGWNFPASVSPDGKWAVYGDCHRALQLVDIKTGKTTGIDSSSWEMDNYEWSPDSRYIAYTAVNTTDDFGATAAVRVYDVNEKKIHAVTDPLFSCFTPTWDPQGKWLYFISARYMNPYGSANDWSFIILEPDQIFGLALDPETMSPYAYYEDGTPPDKEKDGKDEKKDDKKKDEEEKEDEEKKAVEVKIVWDGLQDRLVKFPVEPGNYFGLWAIEGKLYFAASKPRGWRPQKDDDEDGAVLKLFDVKKTKTSDVMSGVQAYTLSGDRKKIAVRTKDGFQVMDAGATEPPEPDKDDKDAGLHLEDWIYDVDPRVEWRQIFDEAWRLERDFFYAPNMHGVDWKAQREHYGSLLNRIRTRDELNDLIGQLIGELSAGHTYTWGGDTEKSRSVGVGLLGIDASRTPEGFYRIDRVLKGESWDPKRTSPLTQVGMNVKDGEYLVAVDGMPTSSVSNYLQLLNNKAGRVITVSINDRPSLEGARKLVVKPMGSENDLRYWDWVYGRMQYVREHAGDDIAYVHLSNMGSDGLEQWMKEYYTQADKKALIIDVRHNGGGNIARWILNVLERDVWSWGTARNGMRYRSPGSGFYGHIATLCNGGTGSDGETFSEGFKRLGLGKLIGERTWGGWVGIRGDKPLLDHGTITRPEFTGWGKEGTWLIEGPGVYPDVEVVNHPKQVLEGRDEQLDYAIGHLRDLMKKEPKVKPPMPPFPDKSAKGDKK
ncbi:PDZ domain-containing protein [bacterium]|nr:PDZ domain-containing protein [bacterium]